MTMIEFLEKHETVLSLDRDDHRQKLTSLKSKLEELQSAQPDYQKISDRMYNKLKQRNLIPKVEVSEIEKGDLVTGVGRCRDKIVHKLGGRVVATGFYFGATHYWVDWEKNIDGHSCDGLARDGYGWDVVRKNIRKEEDFPQPEINSKEDYDDFIAKLRAAVKQQLAEESFEAKVDFESKNFRKDDEVVYLSDFFKEIYQKRYKLSWGVVSSADYRFGSAVSVRLANSSVTGGVNSFAKLVKAAPSNKWEGVDQIIRDVEELP